MSRRLFGGIILGLGLVVLVSHTGSALIAASAYRPGLAWSLGLALTVGCYLAARRDLDATGALAALRLPSGVGRDLLLLLAVAVLFRFAPIPEFPGGRDDGVYTNMAAFLMRNPSPTHQDQTVGTPADLDGREFLAAEPQHRAGVVPWVPEGHEGRLEGGYLPGVYVADAETLTYTFQFVHVLPIWLSVVGAALGLQHMGYAVVGFSLLSVVVFYLLALSLGGHRGWALAGGLLLAVNPLHAYFARNPVTETLALFFNLTMLLSLVWAWRIGGGSRGRWWLVALAVAAYSAFCLTRMNGFFALPFVAVAAVYLLSLTEDSDDRRLIWCGALAFFAVFGLAAWYLVATSFPYALSQYAKIFRPLLGEGWLSWMPWAAGLGVACTVLAMLGVTVEGPVRRGFVLVRRWLVPLAMTLMLAAVVYHALKVARLATGGVEDHVGYVARFDLAGQGLQSLKHSSLVNLAVYLSPPVMVLLVWEFLDWRRSDHRRALLVFLLAGYLIYVAALQWVLPFQFYYGRYLLSAVLPYGLLLVVCSAAWRPGRWRGVLAALGVVWCLGLSVTQWQYRGQETFLRDLEAAVAPADRDDLVLLDRRGVDHAQLTLPLIYALERNVWTFADEEHLRRLLDLSYRTGSYPRIWVASPSLQADYLEPVRQGRLTWSHPRYAALHPMDARERSAGWTMNRVRLGQLPWAQVLVAGRQLTAGVRCEGFGPGRVWTAERFSVAFDAPLVDRGRLRLACFGWRPQPVRLTPADLSADLNGRPLELVRCEPEVLEWAVPEGGLQPSGNRLTVTVTPWVPAQVIGSSSDQRSLGIDLESLELR